MIAAQKLRLDGARNIGVLDLDRHIGNGTDDIIWQLSLDYITHYTFGGERIDKGNAEEWLKDLPDILARFADCDIVLYQAGADPHVDDPLGGVLTTEQLYERDFLVFHGLKSLNISVSGVATKTASRYSYPDSKKKGHTVWKMLFETLCRRRSILVRSFYS